MRMQSTGATSTDVDTSLPTFRFSGVLGEEKEGKKGKGGKEKKKKRKKGRKEQSRRSCLPALPSRPQCGRRARGAADPTPAMAAPSLKTVVFFGSGKDVAPFWAPGGDTRLGDRVLKYVLAQLGARSVAHDVTVFDPLEVFGEGGALASSGAEVRTPHFYLGDRAPAAMDAMRAVIKAADAFVVVTPEYNHSAPSALTGLLNHFGGSNYAYKPSAIVTYSVGPWGGARAQVALRAILGELGCLPVSKMAGLPMVEDQLEADGTPKDPESRLMGQVPGLLDQLEWMASAMKNHRDAVGTPQ